MAKIGRGFVTKLHCYAYEVVNFTNSMIFTNVVIAKKITCSIVKNILYILSRKYSYAYEGLFTF